MKTIKTKPRFFGMVLLAVAMLCATSCKKDNILSSGLQGWYTDLSKPAKTSDFNEINTAINNHELLMSYSYSNNYYATYDLFIDDDNGNYYDGAAYFGRLRNSVNKLIWAIQIVDNSTLKIYSGALYPEGGYGTNGMESFYRLYAGSIFGNMAYYATPVYYTYVKTDNMIVVSNGDIYTVSNGTLIKDGSSTILSKYDPSKLYSSGSGGGNSGGGNSGGGNNGGGTNVSGTYNGHEYVDLGLPSGTKWATCNVGFSTPEGNGSYFAWGETTTKSSYTYDNYRYGYVDNNGFYHLNKYNTDSEYGPVDNLSSLQTSDDAATAKWGNGWRIPTESEWEELYNHTTVRGISQNGVNGIRFTASNGGSIFLPAAGRYYYVDLISRDANYWTNQIDTSWPVSAKMFTFSNSSCHMSRISREVGMPVRAVH